MNLDWDKLRIFHAVAEAGSFTRAGETLNLSQSAISRQIATLEDQLGVPLFHRHARGLLLTEQGEMLLKATQEVYAKLAVLEGRMSDTKSAPEGPLKITMPGFLGSAWLAPRIKKFQTLYPRMRLSVLLDNKVYNLGMREADCALRMYEPDQSDLIKRKLTNIHFHLCAAKSYLEEHGAPKSANDLKKHWLIGYPSNVPLPYEQADWLFKIAGVDKDNAPNCILINSMQAIMNTIENGAGIACLPDFMVHNNPLLEVVLGQYQTLEVPVFFAYPEERRSSSRIQVFRDFLIAEMSQKTL